MRDGFVKVAALTPSVRVADVTYNKERIVELMDEAAGRGARVMVFPEVCITGYTCGDLFCQELLLSSAREALLEIAAHTEGLDAIVFVGLPFEYDSKLYNVAAALGGGKVLGLVPKTFIPNYNEFYERRHFTPGFEKPVPVRVGGDTVVPMGTNLIFACRQMPQLKIGVEICEDLWAPKPPCIEAAMAGATLVVNLSASDETTGKDVYRRGLVAGQSGSLVCGYVYASAGDGESTQDVVYSGHNLIAENGTVLAESRRFVNESIYSEIDVQRLSEERRRMSTYGRTEKPYATVDFNLGIKPTGLTRFVDPAPFVPGVAAQRQKRCEEIFMIQAMGLKKRLVHTHTSHAVVGISGGLDSTLALLVTAKAFDLAGLDRRGIVAITMPGFGTTDRTYKNAVSLIRSIGAEFMEVPIAEAVRLHFRDVGQDENVHDVTYENCQARERTQILMDVANRVGGMVIGTGDMSELALGWATYNGDHMSMYGVNVSVPKTLVRHLVRYYADTCGDEGLRKVLLDVLSTPVSPELLPPSNGQISQKTEDIVGPYELHDFFLYHMLRFGCTPKKIYRLAIYAFEGTYDPETIEKWLKVFYRRFFSQQFKRSCIPDGPKVGTVAISPRGDLRMPSDACVRIWLDEMEHLHDDEATEGVEEVGEVKEPEKIEETEEPEKIKETEAVEEMKVAEAEAAKNVEKAVAETAKKEMAEAEPEAVEVAKKETAKVVEKKVVEPAKKETAKVAEKKVVEAVEEAVAEPVEDKVVETVEEGIAREIENETVDVTREEIAEAIQEEMAEAAEDGATSGLRSDLKKMLTDQIADAVEARLQKLVAAEAAEKAEAARKAEAEKAKTEAAKKAEAEKAKAAAAKKAEAEKAKAEAARKAEAEKAKAKAAAAKAAEDAAEEPEWLDDEDDFDRIFRELLGKFKNI